MGNQDKLIEHLSSEITTHTNYILTFRSRVTFTILVGPFILLGSFLIATKGSVASITFSDKWSILGIILGFLIYLGLGAYGYLLDRNVTEQCDKWRCEIARLSEGYIEEKNLVFRHNTTLRGYLLGIILFYCAFLAITFLLKQLFVLG